MASGAQACFLTVKSTATPPRMHCGTHWRAFWPEKARLCPRGIFADNHIFCYSIHFNWHKKMEALPCPTVSHFICTIIRDDSLFIIFILIVNKRYTGVKYKQKPGIMKIKLARKQFTYSVNRGKQAVRRYPGHLVP